MNGNDTHSLVHNHINSRGSGQNIESMAMFGLGSTGGPAPLSEVPVSDRTLE
jgi:hypothetical protein